MESLHRVGIDEICQARQLRRGTVVGKCNRILDFPGHAGSQCVDFILRDQSVAQQILLEQVNRILRDPAVDFFLAAVTVAITLGVTAVAVGQAFDQRRPAAVERSIEVDMPYLLFSHTNTTGSFQIAARFRPS